MLSDLKYNLLDSVLSLISVEGKELSLLGDINCNYLGKKNNTEVKSIFTLYGLKQLITVATRITKESSTLIDVILTNKPSRVTMSTIYLLMIYFIVNSELHNYADDNTISAFSNSIPHLIEILEKESNIAISWLKKNKMIANSEKFHSIILTKNKDANINLNLKIGNKTIRSEQHIKLLGVKIDNKLNFCNSFVMTYVGVKCLTRHCSVLRDTRTRGTT